MTAARSRHSGLGRDGAWGVTARGLGSSGPELRGHAKRCAKAAAETALGRALLGRKEAGGAGFPRQVQAGSAGKQRRTGTPGYRRQLLPRPAPGGGRPSPRVCESSHLPKALSQTGLLACTSRPPRFPTDTRDRKQVCLCVVSMRLASLLRNTSPLCGPWGEPRGGESARGARARPHPEIPGGGAGQLSHGGGRWYVTPARSAAPRAAGCPRRGGGAGAGSWAALCPQPPPLRPPRSNRARAPSGPGSRHCRRRPRVF